MDATPRPPPAAERGFQQGTRASTTAGTSRPVVLRGESADRRKLATSAPNASDASKNTQSITTSASDGTLIHSKASEVLSGPNDTQAPAPASRASSATRRVLGGRALVALGGAPAGMCVRMGPVGEARAWAGRGGAAAGGGSGRGVRETYSLVRDSWDENSLPSRCIYTVFPSTEWTRPRSHQRQWR